MDWRPCLDLCLAPRKRAQRTRAPRPQANGGRRTTKRQMSQPAPAAAVLAAGVEVACHRPRGYAPCPTNARHGPRNCAPCRSNARHDPRGVAVQPTRAVSAISLQADPGYPRMRSSIWRGPPPYGARPAAADTGRPASRAVAPGLPGIPPCRRVSITNHGLLDIVDFWSAKTGKFPKKHVTAEAVPGR